MKKYMELDYAKNHNIIHLSLYARWAKNKCYFIWNYNMFVLVAKHYTSKFKLKNVGEVLC